MVRNGESESCPNCGGRLKYWDRVARKSVGKEGIVRWVYIRRFICTKCRCFHRELPDTLMPYKHYEANIIKNVVNGQINSNTIGYEDYPCEITMLRWIESVKI